MSKIKELEEVATESVIVSIDGLSKDSAMTKLIAEYGMTFSKANEYWAENRPTRGTGFASRFYSLLEAGEMSESEFDSLLGIESANVKNHRSHYNSIRILANTIWAVKSAETGE